MTKEFDERNMAKSRRVCEAMAEAASTGKRVLTERERHILDIWPRFEDGKPVMFGDRFIDHRVNERTVRSVIVNNDGVELRTFDGTFDWHETGERVKRPVQSVLDADGVEINVGDKVWLLNGIDNELVVEEIDDESGWVGTRSANGGCLSVYNTHLTHIAPDSWERLEEDAAKSDCDYFGRDVSDCDRCPARESTLSCGQSKSLDIIRRAKALAGVEVSE